MMNKKTYLRVKDYSVSGEEFDLVYNEQFDMLETIPQPQLNKLSDYYKSDDYISHTDSRRNIFEKAYQVVKSIALKRKVKLINSYNFEKGDLLDVGCGTGDFLKAASLNNWKITGIEPNIKARTIANSKLKNVVFDVNELLNFQQNSFDVITLWHVLEHLPNLDNHLNVFKSILKPNGVLVIAIPNFKSYDAKIYGKYWAAYDAPRHLWHFSQNSINRFANLINMEVVDKIPMYFDSYYVSLLSEKYKTGKMNFIKAFFTATLSNLKASTSKEFSSIIYVLKHKKN